MGRLDLPRLAGAWLPVAAWVALIGQLGGDGFSEPTTRDAFIPLLEWLLPWLADDVREALSWTLRRAAHPAVYGVLALLTWRALARTAPATPRNRALALTLGASLLVALADEGRQAQSLVRDGSLIDVGLNLVGAVVTAAGVAATERRRGRPFFAPLPDSPGT